MGDEPIKQIAEPAISARMSIVGTTGSGSPIKKGLVAI
jgi:hypothetical protein